MRPTFHSTIAEDNIQCVVPFFLLGLASDTLGCYFGEVGPLSIHLLMMMIIIIIQHRPSQYFLFSSIIITSRSSSPAPPSYV